MCPYYTRRHNFILCILLDASVIWTKRDVFIISKKHDWVTFIIDQKKKKKQHKTGFRVCLKQIPQPNDNHGDSCCFKSTAAHGHRSPWRRKGMLTFKQNWGWVQQPLWQNQIQHGGGLIGPIQPSLKHEKEDNFIAFSLRSSEGHSIRATDYRTERSLY